MGIRERIPTGGFSVCWRIVFQLEGTAIIARAEAHIDDKALSATLTKRLTEASGFPAEIHICGMSEPILPFVPGDLPEDLRNTFGMTLERYGLQSDVLAERQRLAALLCPFPAPVVEAGHGNGNDPDGLTGGPD